MFAVGHLAFGYLLAKVCQRVLRTGLNLPLVFLLSLLPDVDLLIPEIAHRGITHSIILLTILFIPAFVLYRKNSVPYFVAIAQHSLLGDFISGGTQIFSPLIRASYGLDVALQSSTNVVLEVSGFILMMLIMIWSKDLFVLFRPKMGNFLLVLPEGALMGSAFLALRFSTPIVLLGFHAILFAIFAVSVLFSLERFVFNRFQRS
ncbi:MAG: metal-dependent hydrolase [Candidatus Bathyarchaeales archaeon]